LGFQLVRAGSAELEQQKEWFGSFKQLSLVTPPL
jgi:hypothetical protein